MVDGEITHWRNTAHAGARVTERAFNCKLDRVAALQRTHKMLWFALSAYVIGYTHVL
jgi:membrane-bound lytic murein transglycosylase MltF